MESGQKPRKTPLMLLKAVVLSLCTPVAFGAVIYAGYNHMPYVIAPCIFLAISSAVCVSLLMRYLKGTLLLEKTPKEMKVAFGIGCVILVLSIIGCFIFGITGFAKIEGFVYREYGLYAAFFPCLLAVFCSCVLIYDARYYWRMWEREARNAMAGKQIAYQP